MEEKEESLIKGKILERQFSRTYRFLIYIILFILSIIIKTSQMILIQKLYYESRFEYWDFPIKVLQIIGRISGGFIFIIISYIENRKIVTFICFFF